MILTFLKLRFQDKRRLLGKHEISAVSAVVVMETSVLSSVQMSREQPPPYQPCFPSGPLAPGAPPALTFSSSSYQTFPQNYAGGDQSYSRPPEPMGPFITQPGYLGYWSGPPNAPQHVGGPKPYGAQPKHTVFVVEQQDHDGGGGEDSCLRACSTALCCCCLWNMLTSRLG
ncbi:cysteine-rich and transmembrane domain-containing protein 1-like [Paralichthys olivaceus]|uniref:cysteine-rich and transmembrane domain-containing protein 1-like n=1 Tax=Paralichthys olivaceus TaxID=8255 RepID=UPI00375295FC